MTKKVILIVSIIFSIFAIGTLTFATNTMHDMGNTIMNSATTVKDSVVNGGRTVGNTISNSMTHSSDVNRGTTTRTTTPYTGTTQGYTATRTAATATTISNTTWIWLIVGATTLAIAGMVWYYMATNDDFNRAKNR